MVEIQLPPPQKVPSPFGLLTIDPRNNADLMLLYTYFKAFGDAVNARVANPSDKSITINLPEPVPATHPELEAPDFKSTHDVQFEASTLVALGFLQELADGINGFWNG